MRDKRKGGGRGGKARGEGEAVTGRENEEAHGDGEKLRNTQTHTPSLINMVGMWPHGKSLSWQ